MCGPIPSTQGHSARGICLWAGATRPLVLIITGIGIVVTIVFGADVNAQGGAYATGVFALF